MMCMFRAVALADFDGGTEQIGERLCNRLAEHRLPESRAGFRSLSLHASMARRAATVQVNARMIHARAWRGRDHERGAALYFNGSYPDPGRVATRPPESTKRRKAASFLIFVAIGGVAIGTTAALLSRPSGPGATGSNCSPSYPDVCIAPPPSDFDCGDIPYRNFRVLPPDPHGFDRNGDGVGCEGNTVGTGGQGLRSIGGEAVPQCSDGIDNDGDGAIDLGDPGCQSQQDDDETNGPPPPPPSQPPATIDTIVTMEPESPDPSMPGQVVSMSATLIRSDTGAPLANEWLHIQGIDDGEAPWTPWNAGWYPTDASGRVQGGVVFQSAGENQRLFATFEGHDFVYRGDISNFETHATRQSSEPPPPPPPVPPAGVSATTVTLESESPDPSSVGEVVAFGAVVRRSDTGAGIPGVFIHFEGHDFEGQAWWNAGFYWTDANGRAAGGTQYMFVHDGQALRATFDGDTEFASSTSAVEAHTTHEASVQSKGSEVLAPSESPIPGIVAMVAPIIVLDVIRRWRKR
jgi:hypothetical protein